jgi:xylose isomerase
MRNYLIFKEKARQFGEDREIQALLAEILSTDPSFEPVPLKFSKERAEQIKSMDLNRAELTKKKLPYEKLDQLLIDLLLGVR